MRAGLLRYPIIILHGTGIKSGLGSKEITWSMFSQTKSNVIFKTGDKNIVDNQFTNGKNVDFVIRYNVQITDQMRVKYEGNIYKIIFINPNVLTGQKIVSCEYLEKA